MTLQKMTLVIGSVVIAFMLFNIPMKEVKTYTQDTWQISRGPDYLKTAIQIFAVSLVTAAAFYASGSQGRRLSIPNSEEIKE